MTSSSTDSPSNIPTGGNVQGIPYSISSLRVITVESNTAVQYSTYIVLCTVVARRKSDTNEKRPTGGSKIKEMTNSEDEDDDFSILPENLGSRLLTLTSTSPASIINDYLSSSIYKYQIIQN